MNQFFAYAPGWVLAAYFLAAAVLVGYAIWKYARRGYLFSPYTIAIFAFAFALLIVAPFQYNDQAWKVLSPALTARPFVDYLSLSIGVNSFGFAIIVATVWLVESRRRERKSPPFVPKPPLIAISTVAGVLGLGVLIFTVCLAMVGTVPLFGGRTVFNSVESLRPAYNFANYLIFFATSVLVVWSFIARSRKYALHILLGIVCILFTGGRTSLFAVLQIALLMWVYRRYRGRTRDATWVIVAALSVFVVAGLFFASFRAGGSLQFNGIIQAVFYGNTFSDIRDGAFISAGWDQRMSGQSLGGNTYLAGLLSFVPSSLSSFREVWSWGYFTTSSLFGWDDHYGLRGGWSLEVFMNFGVVGVILAGVACGWLLGRLEAMFYAGVVKDAASWYPNAYLWSWLGYGIFAVLIASSAAYNLYSLVVVVALLWVLSLIRQGLHGKLGIERRDRVDHILAGKDVSAE